LITMTVVQFYEKPGCLTNAKQKRWLVNAGLLLIVHDLLQEPWRGNPNKLRAFFGNMPVSDWFNKSAPDVKNGVVKPEELNEQQAIELMVKQPLLIRRPLIEIDNKLYAGFDSERLNQTHNLTIKIAESAESCSQAIHNKRCQP
jgi:nitrogenase-associated protein